MEFAGLLGVGRRKEKLKLERNKKKKIYLLYIIASYMGNGPSCPGGPGQVPLLPWPRARPGVTPHLSAHAMTYHTFK